MSNIHGIARNKTWFEKGYEEGFKIGFKKGLEEGIELIRESLRDLLDERFGPLPESTLKHLQGIPTVNLYRWARPFCVRTR